MATDTNKYDNIHEIDHIEEVAKFNPYHDRLGRFTSGGLGGAMMAPDKGGSGGAGGGTSQTAAFDAKKQKILENLQAELKWARQKVASLKDTPKNRKTLQRYEDAYKRAVKQIQNAKAEEDLTIRSLAMHL